MKIVLLAVSALCFQAISPSASAQDVSLAGRQADFKTFVKDFKDSYAYLDQPEKPWLTWETRYASAIKRANSKQAFSAVLAGVLSELHDFHASLRDLLRCETGMHIPSRTI